MRLPCASRPAARTAAQTLARLPCEKSSRSTLQCSFGAQPRPISGERCPRPPKRPTVTRRQRADLPLATRETSEEYIPMSPRAAGGPEQWIEAACRHFSVRQVLRRMHTARPMATLQVLRVCARGCVCVPASPRRDHDLWLLAHRFQWRRWQPCKLM